MPRVRLDGSSAELDEQKVLSVSRYRTIVRTPLERYGIQGRGHDTPCWIWGGKPDGNNGYGRIRVGNGRRKPAHVFFYEHHVGPVPDGLQLDHLCCVSLCVNPAHLEPVTGLVNNRRRHSNKLTEADAAQIKAFRDEYFRLAPHNAKGRPRERFAQGVLDQLAAKYGVSKFTIISVIRGRSWR